MFVVEEREEAAVPNGSEEEVPAEFETMRMWGGG